MPDHGRRTVSARLEDEAGQIPFAEGELGPDIAVLFFERDRRREVELELAAVEERVVGVDLGHVAVAAVVESGLDEHLDRHGAADPPKQPDDASAIRRLVLVLDGHEVGDLGDAALGQVASDQDRGVGEVHLLRDDVVSQRPHAETAALLVVE